MAPLHGALLMAVLALPAVGMALWFARDPRPTSAPLARHVALIAIAMLLLALAVYLLGADPQALRRAVVAAAVVINALIVSLLLAIRRVRRRQP